ncbi:MAG: bacterioferritin-associated ferredoxin [Wenzhouxiangellaceae bacterium]
MFICVCNAVSDREIRDLARRGVESYAELQRLTGCGNCCGQCAEEAEDLLVDAIRSNLPVSIPMARATRTA